jgi:hypothetical protein
MRSAAAFVMAGLIAVVAVVALQEATQSRPDPVIVGSTTELTFEVSTRDFSPAADAGLSLWGACAGSMRSTALGVHTLEDDRYEVVLTPALGEHSLRHLEGCVEDTTIERVQGTVIGVEAFDPQGRPLDDDLDELEAASD